MADTFSDVKEGGTGGSEEFPKNKWLQGISSMSATFLSLFALKTPLFYATKL